MGIEGGKRFEPRAEISRRRENLSSGGELFSGRSPEASRELGGASLVEKYITPERLAEVKASPYGENRSAESLLVERLTGVLVESGPGMDPQVKTRLRDYLNGLRIAAYPNMKPHEQELIRDIAEATGGWAEQTIDTDHIGAEIRSTWQKFGFKVPDVQEGEVGSEFAGFYKKPELEPSEVPSVTVPAAQVVLMREGESGPEVFMGHRIAGGFLNQWSFTGGRVDKGESFTGAAVREVLEETGAEITEDQLVHLRDTKSSTVRNKGGKDVRYDYDMKVYVVDGNDLDPQNVSTDEHSEMRWIPVSEALAMHDQAISRAEESGMTLPPDKIPGAIAPRTLETIKFLAEDQ